MDKNTVLNEIIEYYISSRDYNGLPISQMKNYNYKILCTLIENGLVDVLSANETVNPHVKLVDANKIPKEKQIENIQHPENHAVLYPSSKALEQLPIDYRQPYSLLMSKGANHLDLCFFDIEIIERYINNPRFLVIDDGYRGHIYVDDDYYEEMQLDDSIEDEYIKNFGMAYHKELEFDRAICAFVSDLAKLTPNKQMLWKSFELAKQDNYEVAEGFIQNLIYAEWVTTVWIFDALLEEMKIINKQCEKMGIPDLFIKTWGLHFSEKPDNYRNIYLPTLKNYYDFVLVLEKMIISNISYKAFQVDCPPFIKSIGRKNDDGSPKGSLFMLEEWIKTNVNTPEDLQKIIFSPLRNVRKIRQKPAHELVSNSYDKGIYIKQKELMGQIYGAIRCLRLLFSNHPNVKDIEIPEYLVSGENIVFY